MIAVASNSGQSTYTLIYVVLAVLTVTLVPIAGVLLKNILSQIGSNTRDTTKLSETVNRVAARVDQIQKDVDRHERILERVK